MYGKLFIRYALIFTGVGFIAVAVLAFQLGIDNDPGWGPRRFQIVGLGLLLSYVGASRFITQRFSPVAHNLQGRFSNLSWVQSIRGTFQRLSTRIEQFSSGLLDAPIVGSFRGTRVASWLGVHRQSVLLVLSGLGVLWLYVWIITVGWYNYWPKGQNYYALLAEAFQNGQTHLLVDPPQELLALENPYDHHQRQGLDYLWDTTLYNGKYYLYWGPVPAVISALISWLTSSPISDTTLVFTFVIGTALFSVLLLRETYQEFRYPGWVFWNGVAAAAVNVPLIWILTRPTVYEASISGGQFFLMAGFYLAFRAFRHPERRNLYLALSAIALGCASGSRVNLLVSGGVVIAAASWQIYITHQKKLKDALPSLAAFVLPLGVLVAALLWYNYARFGSIFELGHRYQLTGPALPANYQDISSIHYAIPNAFTYLFRLPLLEREFPYFTVPWIKEEMWPFFIRIPEHYYYTEPTAGILIVVPLVGLTLLFALRLGWLFVNGEILPDERNTSSNSALFNWLFFTVLAYVLIQFALLLLFISSAMRYLFDISPALIILCVLFVGANSYKIARTSFQMRLLALIWFLATVLTVLAAILIGLTGDRNNFLNQNPHLYYQLQEWLP